MKNNILEVFAGATTGLVAYFCGLNWEIALIWIMLMTVDIVTGVVKSMKVGKFSSHDMKMGLLKKVGEFFLLFSLVLVQRVASLNGINVPISPLFAGAFCFKELGSIIENSINMDISIPKVVTRWFKVANTAINQDIEDKGDGE